MTEEIDEGQILSIYNTSEGNYKVVINEGASVEEVAFAITVLIKCFDRDGVIVKEDMLKLIDKYLNDVQYEEVQS